MDTYGTDAMRFTFARGANPGQDVPVGEEWVQGARNFCNKLWNAARFALINGASTASPLPPRELLGSADRWILSRLQQVIAEVDANYDDFQFARAAETLYHFAWDEFCDWYVELAKVSLAHGGDEAAHTRLVLGHVLDALLRMLHPFTPYVTEELWTSLTDGESIVIAAWPTPRPEYVDDDAEREISLLQDVVTEVAAVPRRSGRSARSARAGSARGHRDVTAASARGARARARPASATQLTASRRRLLSMWPACSSRSTCPAASTCPPSARGSPATSPPLRRSATQATGKLDNPDFVGKAPVAVVEKIRGRLSAAEADIARISAQLDRLPTA